MLITLLWLNYTFFACFCACSLTKAAGEESRKKGAIPKGVAEAVSRKSSSTVKDGTLERVAFMTNSGPQGVPAVVQQDRQHLGSAGTQV